MEMTPVRDLAGPLALGPHEHVSVVGGGGKTTVVHSLGAALTGTRVLTCTTKMGHDQHRGRPVLLAPGDDELRAAAVDGPVVVWRSIDGQKAIGVAPEDCDRWFGLVDHVVVEADGSRRRPFKAPAEYEPVVPGSTTVLISVVGADAMGRVIADRCHRPMRVAALADCSPYERLSPDGAARVLLHERGARKELPEGARFVVVVSRVDDVHAGFAAELVERLWAAEPELTVLVTPWDETLAPFRTR